MTQMKMPVHGIRLCAITATALLWFNVAPAQESPAPIVRNLADNKFAALPVLPDCWTVATESGDPNKGPSVMLIKGTAGCAVTWHCHTPNEHIMMVSGKAIAQMKDDKPVELRPGGFALMPGHHIHRFRCPTACTSFLYSDGAFDIHFVNESGKDISTEEALKAMGKVIKPSEQR